MDPCIQKVIDAAVRLDAALQRQTGPVCMAVRMAHKRLRQALAGVVPEPQNPVPSGGLSAARIVTPEPGVRASCPRCGSTALAWDGLKEPLQWVCGRCRLARGKGSDAL